MLLAVTFSVLVLSKAEVDEIAPNYDFAYIYKRIFCLKIQLAS